MLDLVRAFVGCPSSDVHLLSLPHGFILAYGFADCVVLLDARTFNFLRALAFREVFPAFRDTKDAIKCISIEPGMRLIAASLGPCVAVWALSGVRRDAWMVHSSMKSIDNTEVTAIDCKSGLLGVSSATRLSVYTLGLVEGLPEWSLKWSIPSQAYSIVRFSPSLMHFASITPRDSIVRTFSTASGKLLQSLRHPRPLKDFIWRFSDRSSRDDLILYTITEDATLRIFLPVLDSPEYLQLHAALSSYSDAMDYELSGEADQTSIFWLHKDTLYDSFVSILDQSKGRTVDGRLRRIQELASEGWDFFLRVLPDNSLVVRAIANLDRRPPTLLKQFAILQSPPSVLKAYPNHLHVLKTPHHSTVVFVTSPPLRTYEMDPALFFEDGSKGMSLLAKGPDASESDTSRVRKIVRSPDGRGLAIVRDSSVEAWHVHSDIADMKRLGKRSKADLVAVFDQGRRMALYTASEELHEVTLHQCGFPDLSSSITVPPLRSLFTLSSQSSTYLVGIAITHDIVCIKVPPLLDHPASSYVLLSYPTAHLPESESFADLLPVDPMAWSGFPDSAKEHDALIGISQKGVLSFWTFSDVGGGQRWTCTGCVSTEKSGYRLASCSSAKKTAFVSKGSAGDELTIWDSKVSEFASGLEFNKFYDEDSVHDLDWTSTPGLDSILAIGFSTHVEILCQQRMTYFENEAAWGTIARIEIANLLTHEITDSSWLAAGSLVIGAGHHMLQYGRKAQREDGIKSSGLFEEVTMLNGPLPDYHPQMMLQCLLWGKVELVKDIIEKLYAFIQTRKESNSNVVWSAFEHEAYLESGRDSKSVESASIDTKACIDSNSKDANAGRIGINRYSSLFNQTSVNVDDDDDDPGKFSSKLISTLIDDLHDNPLEDLTPLENEHLIVLIQTRLEIENQRRALDGNGLRYLISMRSFYILNARASSPPKSPASPGSGPRIHSQAAPRRRLRYRDMLWAFHSESQEILLSASASACGGSMTWTDAKALGLALWVTSADSLKGQLEAIARNQFMSGERRDPTTCSLLYFALGKVRLVHGLWRQAAGHKEQALMLKFLSNDFGLPRWRTAALKNAYALLGKQRFEYAAAFFVLGGGIRDAVNVCVRHLDDPQLAVALARVLEPATCGPVLTELLSNVILPLACREGNRWLGSWAFWMMNRRDLAVQILVAPLGQIARSLDIRIEDIGDPHYDDPSLALLFSQLKSKTLQTVKGAHEISGQTEFNFVLQTARVFRRMGCHALALALVRTWTFERIPSPAKSDVVTLAEDTVTPLPVTRPSFGFGTHGRRASILIDMDVPSDPSTRATSPVQKAINENDAKDTGMPARAKTGLGSLMKSAKQDVNVPEFDMKAFF